MSPTWPPLLTMTQGKGKPFYLCLYEAEMAITLFTSSLQINKKRGGVSINPHTVPQICDSYYDINGTLIPL